VSIYNRTFEGEEEFKYWETTLKQEKSILEEIKSRLMSGNTCYVSVENTSPSRLLLKNLRIMIHRTIVLSVLLYGCEYWSLKLRQERKLRLFENMVLRGKYEPRRVDVTVDWSGLHNKGLNDLYCSPNIERVINIEK